MNWTGLVNWFLSGMLAGVFVFAATYTASNHTTASIAAGISAGVLAMGQHLRDNPFSTPKPPDKLGGQTP